MTTIAQTTTADKPASAEAFRTAVCQVSELAHARLPEALHGNLERATALVLTGRVWREEDGSWQVQASDGQTWYRPNGHCTCRNAATAEGGWCKHRLAAALYRRAAERVQEQATTVDVEQAFEPAPSPAPVALPEAPASVNTYVTVGGRQCQITLRDTDEARLLSRLQVMLAQYPCTAPPATVTPAPAASQEAGEEGWCTMHQVAMHESSNERGTWFSHRRDDGTWCKGPKKPKGGRRPPPPAP